MLYHLSYSREQSAETVEPTVEIPVFAPNQARNPGYPPWKMPTTSEESPESNSPSLLHR